MSGSAFSSPQSPTAGGSTIKMSEPLDDVIPPSNTRRTLVLLFDGTGDQFDTDNSNIVQLCSMLKKDDPSQQLVYYQAGIGTYTIPQIATPFYAKLSKTIDMMVGNNLDAHVMSGYEFLMQNYEAGDKICLFGFSRGAYTARALAGMIHKVGLLPRDNHQQVPFAYKMYSKDDQQGWEQSTAFKKAFSIDVDVEFVGVWDTVNSVGIIPRRLPFTRANNKIRYFRHALALDEHRVRFMPNFYNRSTDADNKLGVQKGEMPRSVKKFNLHIPDKFVHDKSSSNGHHQELSLQDLERRYTESITQTDVEEVWFSGCHCDVGGGSVKNGTRNSLARIPLRWMIREIFKADVGILFHRSMFEQIGMDPSTLYPHVIARPPAIFTIPAKADPKEPNDDDDDYAAIQCDPDGKFVSEELEDVCDALSSVYDQLKIAPYWWILEVLPQKLHYQRDQDDSWTRDITVNMGKGRHIPKREPLKVHRTVKIRMEADTLPEGKYWPKAKIKVAPKWVD